MIMVRKRQQIPDMKSGTDDWYRTLFEHTGTAIVVLNADMSVFSFNSEFGRLSGVGKMRADTSIHFLDLIAPEDRNRLQHYHDQRRLDGGHAPAEYNFQLLSGKKNQRLINVSVDMVPGTDKSILSLIDITDQKKAEQALRESERLMATLLDNFPGIVYQCKYADGWQVRFISPGCKELTGYEAQAFTGPLDQAFTRLIHPEDQQVVRQKVKQALREKKKFGVTYRIRTRSGEEKWVWEQGLGHYSAQGNVISIEGFITDVTERKHAEMELARENKNLKTSFKDRYRLGAIIGRSPAMQIVYEQIVRAAGTSASVVIMGKSGTGKELVARAIHDLSDRKKKAFVPVNCGAIPDNLLESEFFGYQKGAFTGASSDTRGYLDAADGGSLFLDELEALSPIMQVKLLRVIDGYGYTPVGGSETRKPDLRIIAATNVDLQEHLNQGLMREDFYFRINVFPIEMPTLRERPQDIPLLIDHFIEKFGSADKPLSIPPAVREALKNYAWPGNVRELQNTIQRFAATGNFSFFTPTAMLGENLLELSELSSHPPSSGLQGEMEAFERQVILKVLEHNRWRRGQSAAMLKIDRKTLLRKMKRHGIE